MFEREDEEVEVSRLILSGKGNIMQRTISEQDTTLGWNQWQVSNPIPGTSILKTLKIYHGITLVLSVSDSGTYTIHRSINRADFNLVHEHHSKIYGMFLLDMGAALFCAEDGWFLTKDTGLSWDEFAGLCVDSPIAEAAVVVGNISVLGYYAIIAFGNDKKIYYVEYPGGVWEEVYDATPLCTGQWYPTLDGSQVGILAGAGSSLLLSTDIGKNWTVKTVVDGIIQSITVSDKSSTPVFYINVLTQGSEESRLYKSYDLGDSLESSILAVDPSVSAASVFVTGSNTKSTFFAVVGYKVGADGALNPYYKIINEDR